MTNYRYFNNKIKKTVDLFTYFLKIFLKYGNFNFIFILCIIYILLKYLGFERFRTNWFHFFVRFCQNFCMAEIFLWFFKFDRRFGDIFDLEKIMILICPFNMFVFFEVSGYSKNRVWNFQKLLSSEKFYFSRIFVFEKFRTISFAYINISRLMNI